MMISMACCMVSHKLLNKKQEGNTRPRYVEWPGAFRRAKLAVV
jgi:hypothetical protein